MCIATPNIYFITQIAYKTRKPIKGIINGELNLTYHNSNSVQFPVIHVTDSSETTGQTKNNSGITAVKKYMQR